MKRFKSYILMKFDQWLMRMIDKRDLRWAMPQEEKEKLEDEIMDLIRENDHYLYTLIERDDEIERLTYEVETLRDQLKRALR